MKAIEELDGIKVFDLLETFNNRHYSEIKKMNEAGEVYKIGFVDKV